jgi:hypothetical protein
MPKARKKTSLPPAAPTGSIRSKSPSASTGRVKIERKNGDARLGLVCVRANHGTTTEGMCGDLGNVPTDRERWHTRATGGKICPGVVHHPPQPTTVGGGDARDGRGGTASAVAGRRGGGGGGGQPRPRHRESSAVCSWFLVAPPPRRCLPSVCVCMCVCVCEVNLRVLCN